MTPPPNVFQAATTLITPPGEHEIFVFWVQLLLLLASARLLGLLAKRVGQPAVIGELLAGIMLGPSVLGAAWPGGFDWLFGPHGAPPAMLFTVGWIGVTLLLLVTGYETDLGLIRSLGRASAAVTAGSLVLPFAAGIVTGAVMPGGLRGDEATPFVFAAFMGTALAISSLPVIATVLTELDLMRRDFGQITLAAGMANDLVGWIALGVIAGMAQSGQVAAADLAVTLTGTLVLIVLALTVGQRAVDAGLRRLRAASAPLTGELASTVGVAIAGGLLMQLVGVEAVLGAFIAGIVLGRSKVDQSEVRSHLETITFGVFAPVFFATAGLRVDLSLLGSGQGLMWAAIVIAVASLSKFGGAILGARVAGLAGREGLALGTALNARGALEIVIATVGLSLGVLNDASYAVVVVMAMVTSMAAPPLLRAVARDWEGSDRERERLEREQRLEQNVLVRPQRVLVPSRGGPNSLAAARLADLVWPQDVDLTVLSVGGDRAREAAQRALELFSDRSVEQQHEDAGDLLEALTREALMGYGAVVVGADRFNEGAAVSPLVDRMLVESPIPVLVARQGTEPANVVPRRLLVPVTGTRFSRAAQEVAFHAAARVGADVALVHVITTGPTPAFSLVGAARRRVGSLTGRDEEATTSSGIPASSFLAGAVSMAEDLGVTVEPIVREGSFPGEDIVAVAEDVGADLVVLGAAVREVDGRPFLGTNVEYVLDHADMGVAIVAVPPG